MNQFNFIEVNQIKENYCQLISRMILVTKLFKCSLALLVMAPGFLMLHNWYKKGKQDQNSNRFDIIVKRSVTFIKKVDMQLEGRCLVEIYQPFTSS